MHASWLGEISTVVLAQLSLGAERCEQEGPGSMLSATLSIALLGLESL